MLVLATSFLRRSRGSKRNQPSGVDAMQRKQEPETPHQDPFWAADLADIERSVLSGKDVLDLPVKTDDKVPPQGNALLRRVAHLGSYGK